MESTEGMKCWWRKRSGLNDTNIKQEWDVGNKLKCLNSKQESPAETRVTRDSRACIKTPEK